MLQRVAVEHERVFPIAVPVEMQKISIFLFTGIVSFQSVSHACGSSPFCETIRKEAPWIASFHRPTLPPEFKLSSYTSMSMRFISKIFPVIAMAKPDAVAVIYCLSAMRSCCHASCHAYPRARLVRHLSSS